MSARRGPLLRCAGVAIVQLCALAGAQAQGLRHDLFARPALATLQSLRPAPGGNAAPAKAEPVWNPALRAVVAAGRESMANVDGVIVRIGEEIDGYRLTAVGEREVVFVKKNKRYMLLLTNIAGPAAREAPRRSADNAAAASAQAQEAGGAIAAAAKRDAVGESAPAAAPESPARGDEQGSDTKRRTQ